MALLDELNQMVQGLQEPGQTSQATLNPELISQFGGSPEQWKGAGLTMPQSPYLDRPVSTNPLPPQLAYLDNIARSLRMPPNVRGEMMKNVLVKAMSPDPMERWIQQQAIRDIYHDQNFREQQAANDARMAQLIASHYNIANLNNAAAAERQKSGQEFTTENTKQPTANYAQATMLLTAAARDGAPKELLDAMAANMGYNISAFTKVGAYTIPIIGEIGGKQFLGVTPQPNARQQRAAGQPVTNPQMGQRAPAKQPVTKLEPGKTYDYIKGVGFVERK